MCELIPMYTSNMELYLFLLQINFIFNVFYMVNKKKNTFLILFLNLNITIGGGDLSE